MEEKPIARLAAPMHQKARVLKAWLSFTPAGILFAFAFEGSSSGVASSPSGRSPTSSGLVLITKRLSKDFINKAANSNSLIHATITGWGGTPIEPHVMNVEESAVLFQEAVAVLGAERVVLRIDPIIPTEEGVERAEAVFRKLHLEIKERTRVRISFLDNYPHVKARFIAAGIPPLPYSFHAPLQQRQALLKRFPGAEVCGEPGLPCTGCLSKKDLEVLGLRQTLGEGNQRQTCHCLASKTEVFSVRGRCPHGCLYCYWK